MAIDVHDLGAAGGGFSGVAAAAAAAGDACEPDGPDWLERDQLACDLAAIEHAAAALRLGQPALESCTAEPPAPATRTPRPVWLMIGLLWLSTAVVTGGSVAAIAMLVR